MDISPNPELATQRDLMGCYIRTYESSKSKPHKPLLNAHAGLLEGDLRTAFCAGAWIPTIMVAHCSHRGTHSPNRNVGLQAESQKLFGSNPALGWLRQIQNEIMRAGEPGAKSALGKLEGHDRSETHGALANEAKPAVRLLFQSING